MSARARDGAQGTIRSPRLAQLGAFLRRRRERLTPAAVGLPSSRHRTPGPRREDVASLAGISVAWYVRIEQGWDVHPSAASLQALADALRLDPAERAYVFRLARVVGLTDRQMLDRASNVVRAAHSVPSPDVPDGTPPALRHLLDGLVVPPAFVMDRYWDVVGRNAALERFLPELAPARTHPGSPPRNVVRRVLASKPPTQDARGWEEFARACVSGLRASLADVWAECPDDPYADALVEALTRESPEFRAWWPEQQVWGADRPLRRVYDHPRVGAVAVEIMLLDVRSAPGITLVIYTPGDAASKAKLEQLARSVATTSTAASYFNQLTAERRRVSPLLRGDCM